MNKIKDIKDMYEQLTNELYVHNNSIWFIEYNVSDVMISMELSIEEIDMEDNNIHIISDNTDIYYPCKDNTVITRQNNLSTYDIVIENEEDRLIITIPERRPDGWET